MNEQFSAFLDNETSRDETDSVVNQLLRDENLRASWSRQHWLRTTLRAHRGEIQAPVDDGFSRRVMQAIRTETEGQPSADSVTPLHAPTAIPRRRRWRGMTAGIAVAASAAGMVFLVNGGDLIGDDPGADNAPGAATIATNASPPRLADSAISSTRALANTSGANAAMSDLSAGADSSVAASKADSVQGPADHWSVSDPALADELNGYLVDHNGLARGYGLSGTTPAFVRVASYGQEPTQ